MNRMVKDLLRKQENERVEMATLLVSNTKEMLSNLGCDYMLSTASGTDVSKYETIINSLKEELKAAKNNVKEVEVVKEVKVPVETIKEVEVIKEVKVPVEVVKEIEVVKEVPVEVVKEVEVIKEVEVVKEVVKEVSSNDKIIEELQSRIRELEVKIEDKDKLITTLTTYNRNNNKVDTNKAIKGTNQITKEKAPAMPAVKTINEDMTILKNAKTWVFGTYKGVAFQSSKTIVGTVVFDTEKYSLKDETSMRFSESFGLQ